MFQAVFFPLVLNDESTVYHTQCMHEIEAEPDTCRDQLGEGCSNLVDMYVSIVIDLVSNFTHTRS